MFKNYQKTVYVLSCIVISLFLYGCKEREVNVSVLDGLPESTFLTEMKSSLENHIPVAVAFTAEWCPHCRKYKPVFNEVKDLYKDKVTFINIDVDDANGSPISNRFQVRGIPTSAFIRADGSVLKVQVGEIEKEMLEKIADELMQNKKRRKGEPIAPFPLDTNKKEEAKPEETKPTEETKPAEETPAKPQGEESQPPSSDDEVGQPPPPSESEDIQPPDPTYQPGEDFDPEKGAPEPQLQEESEPAPEPVN